MTKANTREVRATQSATNSLPDKELVRIAKLQLPYATTAYEILFQRYYRQLIGVCYRYMNSHEEAEEAANDVMFKVFNKLHQLQEAGTYKAWLFKLAYHQCIDKLRKKNLIVLDNEIADTKPDSPDFMQVKPESVDPQLRVLSQEDRNIVIFRLAGDLEFQEIAQITGLGLSAVKMRYQRALAKMRDKAPKRED